MFQACVCFVNAFSKKRIGLNRNILLNQLVYCSLNFDENYWNQRKHFFKIRTDRSLFPNLKKLLDKDHGACLIFFLIFKNANQVKMLIKCTFFFSFSNTSL